MSHLFCVSLATLVLLVGWVSAASAAEKDPLLDWSDWKKYRTTVAHPSLTVKPADLKRFKANVARYPWAKKYVDGVVQSAEAGLKKIQEDPKFVEDLIPALTPGDPLFTPCPACRDLKKPAHPHGTWYWTHARPHELKCQVCETVYPNEKYPETVKLEAKWGGTPQTLTFYGGEPFVIFGYKQGRPSFSGNIRARQVGYMAGLARQLGEAYALTGRVEFAEAARKILLRQAAVYPRYLVHVGYGEYADMDPRVASFHIDKLPADELCYPPNNPDRSLHTGYWSAGRASGVGQESNRLRSWLEAYDFTCDARSADGKPVYSGTERVTIERDLLLESTILLVADKGINNKSVGNRSAVGMVGMALGHPGLVRFGLEGFDKAVDDWFLPDGHTPESPAYAFMTLNNIDDAVTALRGYSDPPGYAPRDGKRLEKFDPYRDPSSSYPKVWEALVATMQGDLKYPPFADSYRHTAMTPHFAELLVANYPDKPEFLRILAELCGEGLDKNINPVTAVYYREPGLEERVASAPKLKLPDLCPPELRIGFLRSGDDGRDSLLLLSASHWGSHHHQDSLNLYYWKQGRELLSDLGYLWDHPDKKYTARTFAHNTVLIDGKDQETKERGGDVRFFVTDDHVKAMRARSKAYPDTKRYERTSAVVDHGQGRSYVVDFFFVDGGETQDFVFHGPSKDFSVDGLSMQPWDGKVYDLADVKAASEATGTWSMTWKVDDAMRFTAWNVGQPGEKAFVGEGWGQRDHKNTDVGATLPYVVRRTGGGDVKVFATVFEGYAGDEQRVVRSVKRLDLPSGRRRDAAALVIETPWGRDEVVCTLDGKRLEVQTPEGAIEASAKLSVRSVGKDGGWAFTH